MDINTRHLHCQISMDCSLKEEYNQRIGKIDYPDLNIN
jgi:hypothetical protein